MHSEDNTLEMHYFGGVGFFCTRPWQLFTTFLCQDADISHQRLYAGSKVGQDPTLSPCPLPANKIKQQQQPIKRTRTNAVCVCVCLCVCPCLCVSVFEHARANS